MLIDSAGVKVGNVPWTEAVKQATALGLVVRVVAPNVRESNCVRMLLLTLCGDTGGTTRGTHHGGCRCRESGGEKAR
jgi:hypothetical protein